MQRLRLMAVFASVLFPTLVACTDAALAPENRAIHVSAPTLDVLPTLIEYTVTAEDFSLARERTPGTDGEPDPVCRAHDRLAAGAARLSRWRAALPER